MRKSTKKSVTTVNFNDDSINVIRNRPVAKFWYKGTHSKPVRRTILIDKLERGSISGYEVREGRTVKDVTTAQYKTFNRSKIKELSRHSINSSY